MSFVHQNVSETCEEYYRRFRRQIFITPKTLLTHLDSYKAMYVEKYENIQMQSKRMESGLIKLDEGGAAIKILTSELMEQNQKLKAATEQAALVCANVQVDVDAAEVGRTEVAKIKVGAQAIVKQITQDTAVVEKKLAKAKPALDEAQAALNVNSGFLLPMRPFQQFTFPFLFRRSHQRTLQLCEDWESHRT